MYVKKLFVAIVFSKKATNVKNVIHHVLLVNFLRIYVRVVGISLNCKMIMFVKKLNVERVNFGMV